MREIPTPVAIIIILVVVILVGILGWKYYIAGGGVGGGKQIGGPNVGRGVPK